jgi:phytoene synthase
MAGSSAVYTPCRPHAHGRHRLLLPADQQRGRLGLLPAGRRTRARASLVATAPTRTATEEAVYEVVLRQAALVDELQGKRAREAGRRRWREEEEDSELGWGLLGDAYDRCGEVCAEYAKTFYLGELRPLSHVQLRLRTFQLSLTRSKKYSTCYSYYRHRIL